MTDTRKTPSFTPWFEEIRPDESMSVTSTPTRRSTVDVCRNGDVDVEIDGTSGTETVTFSREVWEQMVAWVSEAHRVMDENNRTA